MLEQRAAVIGSTVGKIINLDIDEYNPEKIERGSLKRKECYGLSI